MWIKKKSQKNWNEFNSTKLWLRRKEVHYLCHLISGDSLKPDPEIITMQKLTDISEPLRKLTYKDASGTWQSVQELTFKKIKQLVTAAPILQSYNVIKEVTIQCD